MTGDRPRRRSKATARAVTAGLCAVLAALASVAIWGGLAAERSTVRLERSGDLVGAYLALTRAVAVQDAAEEGFAQRTRRSSRAKFAAAEADIAGALKVLERLGDPKDQALRVRIERLKRRYAADFRRYFGALDAGDAERAEAADPSSQALQVLVRAGPARRATRCGRSTPSAARRRGSSASR